MKCFAVFMSVAESGYVVVTSFNAPRWLCCVMSRSAVDVMVTLGSDVLCFAMKCCAVFMSVAESGYVVVTLFDATRWLCCVMSRGAMDVVVTLA